MYEPSRLKYPLRRKGKRGSGAWERQTWDQALTQVADTLLDVALLEDLTRVIRVVRPDPREAIGLELEQHRKGVLILLGAPRA